jgi:indoleamine 2,3-dioxygenase
MVKMFLKRFFHLLPKNHSQTNLPPFIIGVENGFLPRQDPLVSLPKEFQKLEDLLQRMPVRTADGKLGLLHHGTFGDAINKELPVYNVDSISDYRLLTGNTIKSQL